MTTARVRTEPGKPATKMVAARVTPDLYDAVDAAARAEGVTMSHYLNRLIRDAVGGAS
jgi:predicted HicB family RNase H-like nuclease